MNKALIVCDTQKGVDFFHDFLRQNGCRDITVVDNGGEARRRLVDIDYDLCIINAPLARESGEQLAVEIAEKNICQVILFVKSEFMEEMTERVEDFGVITVAKPISRQLFWSALKLAKVAQRRIVMAHRETVRLQQKLEDIKLISRAKCVLIAAAGLSEEEAHRQIERQAMDRRLTRVEVARQILEDYQ